MASTLRVSKRFATLAKRLENLGTIRAMNRAAPKVRDFIKSKFMGGSRTAVTRLARNTGAMERHTIATRAEKDVNGVSAKIKINVPYATTHFTDTGKRVTLIKPVTRLHLTVPILKNAQGRPPKPASGYTNKFASGGILFAVQRKKGIFPIFSLRESVRVPTRIDIKQDIEPTAKRIVAEELEKEIDAALKRD